MVPRREEFIQDVRRAVRHLQKPLVAADSDRVDTDDVARGLHRADHWLTPKFVEAYAPADFAELSGELQAELREAVEQFRTQAAQVPADQPPDRDQFEKGLHALTRLSGIVRRVVLDDWARAVETLIDQVERWADEFGWRTRRDMTRLIETLLGSYTLPVLQMYGDGQLYVLNPVARFVPGALGAMDLSIQPSFFLASVYRHFDGCWYANFATGPGINGTKREPLTKDSLKRAAEALRALV